MEYSPPPLFKQGASARAKVVFFSLIALILLVGDSRLRSLGAIRQAVGTALYPLQVAALAPRDAILSGVQYFSTVTDLQRENEQMRLERTADAILLQQARHLFAENAQLRNLLDASQSQPVKSVMGEVLYDARDAFSRKIVLDRGTQHGVMSGQPVIDHVGVVGQVTRVFPFTSEVTLITDRDQAIPVQLSRNGLRSIAYGQGRSGAMDLRFMPINADIEVGDVLVTSGLDGVYPPGLAVARVTKVETASNDAFVRVVCQPLAGIENHRHLLILLSDTALPAKPGEADGSDAATSAPAAAAPNAVAKPTPAPTAGAAASASSASAPPASAPAPRPTAPPSTTNQNRTPNTTAPAAPAAGATQSQGAPL